MNDNPYQTPVYGHPVQGSPGPFGTTPQVNSLGTFVLTILIIDIVLCGIRLLMGAFGIVGYTVIPPDHPLRATVLFEVGTAFGIALFGIPANALILFKQKIGLFLAALAILVTLANMAVGLWQGFLQFQELPGAMEGAERAGMIAGFILGAGFVLILRVVLLGLYVGALVMANRTLSRQ